MTVNEHSWESFNDIDKKGLIVLKAWADWCAACKEYDPAFESVSENQELEGVLFTSINVAQHENIDPSYVISGIPATFILVDGVQKSKIEGGVSDSQLTEEIRKYL